MSTNLERTAWRAWLVRLVIVALAVLGVQSAAAVNIYYPGDEPAIERAALAGERVILSQGVYRFASGWRLTEPAYVSGAGAGMSVLVFEEPTPTAALVWAGEGELVLKQLSIELAPGLGSADVVRVESGLLELEDVELSGGRAVDGLLDPLGAGLRVVEEAEARLVGAVVARNAGFGVVAEGRSTLQVSFTRLTSNRLGGLLANGAASVSVVDSEIVRNIGDSALGPAVGVATDGHGWATLLRTRIDDNSTGITLNWYSAITAVDVSISHNSGSGVGVYDNGWLNVRGGTVARNGGLGLQVMMQGRLAVIDSVIEHNVGYGLWANDDATLTIVGNAITDNGSDGLEVGRRARGAVVANQFARNGGHGFACTDTASVSFIRNRAHDNAGTGFSREDSATCSEHYSTFTGDLGD